MRVNDFEWRPGETVEVNGEKGDSAARLFRDVVGRYPTGVTVVTTSVRGEPLGMTCSSFTSVSLNPPLVAFLPTKQSRVFASIQRTGTFCVNLLADSQRNISEQMASRRDDKFTGVAWTPSSATGSPLLSGVVGYIDCAVHAAHEAGDHYVVIGRVLDLAVGGGGEPLLYHRGTYGQRSRDWDSSSRPRPLEADGFHTAI